jgi:hypothetical protein
MPTETVALSPELKATKERTLAQAKTLTDALTVNDEASLAQAQQWLQVVLKEKDALESMRTSVTKPMNAALREINGWFKPLRQICEHIEGRLKGQVGDYVAAQRRLADQQYQAAVVAHKAGNHDVARQALAVASEATTDAPQGVTVREEWTYVIKDGSKIPREFLIIDQKKLAAHCKAAKNGPPAPIKGVEFVTRQQLSVRRR